MLYLGNAFSIGMLAEGGWRVNFNDLSVDEAARFAAHATSVVGHEDTALLMSRILGTPIAVNRASLSLKWGDSLLVGQYNGPRLAPGVTELPEGASIRWVMVSFE